VNRGDPYGARTVYACAWRTGRARTIGSRVSLDTESADTKVRAHAGVHLVVDASHDDQYAHAVRTTWWNIATGRKRTLYALDAPIAGLGLAGRTATWTNAGQPRRADLARAAC
jgi:hypothetical protein